MAEKRYIVDEEKRYSMILAEKIIKLRKKNGWSQEELAAQMNVSRQSVSKWESMSSIPDLDKIVKLSQLFGVSTDYLLKDELEDDEAEHIETIEESEKKYVSLNEANEFMGLAEENALKVAAGVAACIFSPVMVILLTGYAECGLININEDKAAGIGTAILLVIIACAVMLFIMSGTKMKKYEYLESELLETEYGVASIIETKKESYADTYKKSIAAGVAACIISVVPLVLAATITENDIVIITMTAFMLTMIAAGVFLIIRSSIINDSYEKLLEEGDYSPETKINNKKNENLSKIYWCTALAIYLAWSFISGDWQMTWVIWPIAGIMYGAVTAAIDIRRKKK